MKLKLCLASVLYLWVTQPAVAQSFNACFSLIPAFHLSVAMIEYASGIRSRGEVTEVFNAYQAAGRCTRGFTVTRQEIDTAPFVWYMTQRMRDVEIRTGWYILFRDGQFVWVGGKHIRFILRGPGTRA